MRAHCAPICRAGTVSRVMKTVPVLLALLLVGAASAHAQTWLTDPAFGARRDAYGPGVLDAGTLHRGNEDAVHEVLRVERCLGSGAWKHPSALEPAREGAE
jgi:hypothetical protein